jgi:hypothetical protein
VEPNPTQAPVQVNDADADEPEIIVSVGGAADSPKLHTRQTAVEAFEVIGVIVGLVFGVVEVQARQYWLVGTFEVGSGVVAVAPVELQTKQYWLVGTFEAGSVVVVVVVGFVVLVVVLLVVVGVGGVTVARGRTRCASPLSVSD